MERSYNLRSPAVKRLMREAKELHEPTNDYSAKPLDDNLFEWHFTFRGPEDSEFQGGIYHGRIILPPDYPMKPPSIMLLNANGRFELNKKICLSISGYHPESWQPSWSIRTAILAIIGFMPTKGEGAIGALDYTPEERKVLARKSRSYSCPSCGPISALLPEQPKEETVESESEKKDRELAKQIMFAKPKQASKPEPPSPSTSSQNQTETASQDDASAEGLSEKSENVQEQQAAVQNANPVQQPVVTPVQQVRRQQQNETTSLMLIAILAVAIAVLFFRRLNRMYDISSSLGGFF